MLKKKRSFIDSVIVIKHTMGKVMLTDSLLVSVMVAIHSCPMSMLSTWF